MEYLEKVILELYLEETEHFYCYGIQYRNAYGVIEDIEVPEKGELIEVLNTCLLSTFEEERDEALAQLLKMLKNMGFVLDVCKVYSIHDNTIAYIGLANDYYHKSNGGKDNDD